jgi:hypothetical protein
MLPCWRSSTEQSYFLTRDSIVICLRKKTTYYVLKEVLYKNISFIAAVRVFMKFSCVILEVNKEEDLFQERIKNRFLDYMKSL